MIISLSEEIKILRNKEKLSLTEIANKLKISKSTVKYHLYPKIKQTYLDRNKKARFHKPSEAVSKGQNSIYYAVKKGYLPSIKTQICEKCKHRPAYSYHHHKGYDFKYILDVIPLCQSCHVKEHYLKSI